MGRNILRVVLPSAALLITVGPQTAVGQSSRAPTSVQRRVDDLNRQGEQYEREQLDAELKGKSNKEGNRTRAHVVAAEVQQDFKDLQDSYNHIVLTMSKPGFSYEPIHDAVSLINKSSTRLKHNLALPKPTDPIEESSKRLSDSEKLEDLLQLLRKHIYSFVTNPMFETQGVLNVDQAKAASDDLEKILELSKIIKRNGER